jgi:radical SAM protein with 4Fe4S-binding SPASM domain
MIIDNILNTIKLNTIQLYRISIYPFVSNYKLNRIKNAFNKSKYPTLNINQVIKYNKYRVDGPQRLLCNAPFTSLFINMNGNVNVCGYNQSYIIGNVLRTPLSKIWLNEKHLLLQKSIANFDLSNGCNICQQKIDMQDYHRAAIYFDTPKISKPIKLKKITFELSNLCNLECIMCNGELSSLINKNREKNENYKQNNFTILIDDLDNIVNDLTFTQFLGGEPLLIKPYYKIWEKIINNNKYCKISVQTNATILPNNFIEIINKSKDKQFIISISIDSFIKENYEKIRLNADFETVMNNIQYFISLRNKNKIELSLNFVPMNTNWKEIPYAIKFANNNSLILSMCELDSPFEYSFYAMNANKLNNIIIYLESIYFKKSKNIIEEHNSNLYKNQIVQLKNICNITLEGDRKYLENNTLSINDLKKEFEENILNLPVLNAKISHLIDNIRQQLISINDEVLIINMLKKINRYFFIRKVFFTQKVDTSYTTNRFENLLYYELRSAFMLILKV